MRYLFYIIIFLFITSCNKTTTAKKSFYPFIKKMDISYNISIDQFENSTIITQTHNDIKQTDSSNSENLISFLTLKKDTLLWKTKKTDGSESFNNLTKIKNRYLRPSTIPRTLGKNLRSTNFIAKYDENFKFLSSKEFDLGTYPSAESFIIANENNLIHISNLFNHGKAEELILRECNLNFEILREVKYSTQIKSSFRPIFSQKYDDKHFILIADKSSYEKRMNNYDISLFDNNLILKWTKQIQLNNITNALFLSKTKTLIITNNINNNETINTYDYKGDFLKSITISNFKIDEIIANNDSFFVQGKYDNGISKILKLDNKAKILSEEIIDYTNYYEQQKFIVSKDGYFLCYYNSKNGIFKISEIFKNNKSS